MVELGGEEQGGCPVGEGASDKSHVEGGGVVSAGDFVEVGGQGDGLGGAVEDGDCVGGMGEGEVVGGGGAKDAGIKDEGCAVWGGGGHGWVGGDMVWDEGGLGRRWRGLILKRVIVGVVFGMLSYLETRVPSNDKGRVWRRYRMAEHAVISASIREDRGFLFCSHIK